MKIKKIWLAALVVIGSYYAARRPGASRLNERESVQPRNTPL